GGAEVPLAQDQRVAHRPGLHQAHHRVVDRGVAVGVVVAHHLADHLRALREGAVGAVAAVEHRVDDAAVDGLEAVAHVRQGAGDDHAHRVVEVGPLHLVVEIDLRDAVDLVLVQRVHQGHGAGGRLGLGDLVGAVGRLLAADADVLRRGRGLVRGRGVVGGGGVLRGVAHGGEGLSGGAEGSWGPRGRAVGGASRGPTSDVEEADVLGVLLYAAAAGLDVVPHQHGADGVGVGGLVDRDLLQGAGGRVHGGGLQLLPVHLAQTLVALD